MEVDASTPSYRCECGAAYHDGCSRFKPFCVRCERPIEASYFEGERTWLPKRPVFTSGEEESIVSSFRCMSCDAAVTGRDAFCHDCGFHLSTMKGFMCLLCGCQVEVETGFCRHCGTLYTNQEKELYLCPCCLLVNAYGERCSCGFVAEADAWHRLHAPA